MISLTDKEYERIVDSLEFRSSRGSGWCAKFKGNFLRVPKVFYPTRGMLIGRIKNNLPRTKDGKYYGNKYTNQEKQDIIDLLIQKGLLEIIEMKGK